MNFIFIPGYESNISKTWEDVFGTQNNYFSSIKSVVRTNPFT